MAKYETSLDLCFAALADPTRRALVQRLARGAASVSELAGAQAVALPTIMAHLAKLEQAGLVVSRKQGRTRLYDLTPGGLAPVEDWMTEQRRIWGGLLDRFDDYVATVMKDRADDA